MNEEYISELCFLHFSIKPDFIKRCSVGHGNYVYIVTYGNDKIVIRCNEDKDAYKEMTYWLKRLSSLDIPIPKLIDKGSFKGYEFVMLSYIEGVDLGIVYSDLTTDDKREIAKEVIRIQNEVGTLRLEKIEDDWSWSREITELLNRAKERICSNGYIFDTEKVERLEDAMIDLDSYFLQIKPIPYLDDITTKNLLIADGRVSGIIDIDWIGIGDPLTFAALTNMALLNMRCDTVYISFLLEEMKINSIQKKSFLFYTLMFCVDFMGERGMQFMDKRIEVNARIIDQLNLIYDQLWAEWCKL